jgi:hypothetical protein
MVTAWAGLQQLELKEGNNMAKPLDVLKSLDKALNKGAVIVADNVEVSKNEMLDYLEYVRSSGGIYKSETI